MLFNIEINDQQVTAKRGETIMTVLNRNGITVPTLCHLSNFSPTGACRMCVVEVDGYPGLVPACSHPIEEWMKIRTHSPRVLDARKTLVELLLAGHPDDCLYCERSGNCELQNLAKELGVHERKYHGNRVPNQIDKACPSIERDPAKCILCGRCIRICNETIGLSAIDIIGRGSKSRIGTSYNKGLNTSTCIRCGQCILVCPTNALSDKPVYVEVLKALNNPNLFPVVQFSPTIPSSIAEDLGLRPSKDIPNLLRAALKKMGFKQVFDTAFGADISLMEEAAEFADRLNKNGPLPFFTGSCPSWVSYIRSARPGFIPNLSSVKSPQQIMGGIIKNYITQSAGHLPKDVYVVSVMPCTSKKYEAETDCLKDEQTRFVDAVITTRELVKMIYLLGIDFANLEPVPTETAFNMCSSSGKMFGVAGGALEGLLRTVYPLIAGSEGGPVKIMDLRGLKGRKEAKVKIGKQQLHVAAVSGLANVFPLLNELEAGRNDLHIIEVMACPYGCINGGGQRIGSEEKHLKARMKALYDTDEEEMIKVPHKNPVLTDLYEKFLGKPFSDRSREFLYVPDRQSDIK